MNHDRMLALADLIERVPPDRFNMMMFFDGPENCSSRWHYMHAGECGTSCCIGGWACVLALPDPLVRADVIEDSDEEQVAREWLGLTFEQAQSLFFSNYDQTNLEAAAKIRRWVEADRAVG